MSIQQDIINYLSQFPGGEYLQNKYVFSLLVLVIFVILAKLVLVIFSKYLERLAKKTKTKVDDLIFDHTKKPIFYLILAYGLKLALLNLESNAIVPKIVDSLMAIVFVYILLRVFDIIIESWGMELAKKTKTNIDEVILPIFQKAGKVVFFIIAFMWVLNVWNLDITPYLAGVGISGLVLGMALQDSLKNVFGGISLLLDKNFKVGDPVKLESGELGEVREIGLRSTKLLTYDKELIFVPNGQLANMRISNFIKPNKRVRKIVDFSVAYGTDVEKVRKIVLEAMKKVKDVYSDPYMDVIFTVMGDSGLHFKARFFVDWDNAYSKFIEMTDVVHSSLNKAGIEIPYPTQTLYVKK